MAYDPSGYANMRSEALARLANLAQNRTAMNDYMVLKEERLQREQARREKQAALDSSRGAFGMAGMGAAMGSMAGPIGGAVGAGAGLLLGAAAEAKAKQRIQGGGFMSNFGQSLARAPSFQELPAMASGAMGIYGAAAKAEQAAKLAKMGMVGAGAAGQLQRQMAAPTPSSRPDMDTFSRPRMEMGAVRSQMNGPYVPGRDIAPPPQQAPQQPPQPMYPSGPFQGATPYSERGWWEDPNQVYPQGPRGYNGQRNEFGSYDLGRYNAMGGPLI